MKLICEARNWHLVCFLSAILLLLGACGVKGPPVAPEDLLLDTTEIATNDEDVEEEQELGSD